ncbi:hypothetical protein M758_8G135800 [Ceratodon purpureus]|nr:hypothetical protein M758_8G135800 [Ceratodon purpureus]
MGEKKSCDVLLIMMLLMVGCVQKQSCTKLVNISQGSAVLNLIILHYVSVISSAGIRQELLRIQTEDKEHEIQKYATPCLSTALQVPGPHKSAEIFRNHRWACILNASPSCTQFQWENPGVYMTWRVELNSRHKFKSRSGAIALVNSKKTFEIPGPAAS